MVRQDPAVSVHTGTGTHLWDRRALLCPTGDSCWWNMRQQLVAFGLFFPLSSHNGHLFDSNRWRLWSGLCCAGSSPSVLWLSWIECEGFM
jgi:hypothetical protein